MYPLKSRLTTFCDDLSPLEDYVSVLSHLHHAYSPALKIFVVYQFSVEIWTK